MPDNEIEIRVNEHVLVMVEETDHRTTEDGYKDCDYQIYLMLTMGDASIQYYIVGEKLRPAEDWVIEDITIDVGVTVPDDEDELTIHHEEENIAMRVGNRGNETVRSWLQQARAKGSF